MNYWEKVTSERVGRRRLLKGGAALSVGAAALALVGCGSDDSSNGGSTPSTGGTPSAAGEPQSGGRFSTVLTSSSAHYNIFANYQEGYNLSGVRVYDRPMTRRLDSRGYVLEAAESVEAVEELKVVIKLKPNMVFQNLPPVNGRAVKASDIVATQDYVKNLPNAENSGFQRGYLERAEATDDHTVVYTLQKPFAYLFGSTMLCNPTGQSIAPAELLQGNMETQTPVGSGAYQQAEAQVNTRYLYRKNPTYRDAAKGLPYIDEHEVILLTDPVAIEASLRNGQIQRWNNPPSGVISRILSDMGNNIVEDPYLSTSLFISNMRMNKAPWNDPRVREAFYRLTDRQQLVDLVFQGRAVVPTGPIHASITQYQLSESESAQYYKKDIAQAKQLLEAANFPFDRQFEITINNTTFNNTAGEVWAQQLSEAGIKTRPTPIPFAEWLPNRIGKGEFDLVIGSTPGQDTPFRALRQHHSDTLDVYNFVGIGDSSIDALIEKSETTLDEEENIKLVKQIQLEVLKKYSGSYNHVTQQTTELRSPKIQNYEVDILFGQVFRQDWWFQS